MRAILAGLVVAAVGVAGGATTLAVGSAAQWVFVDVPSLNTFIRLANQTIAFVNERAGSEPVPPIPALGPGVGLRLSEAVGGVLRVGLQMAVANVGTRTQGTWTAEETSHPVDISLDVGFVAFAAELDLVLVPEILIVSASAGWGSARIGYRCVFPPTLPTDWSLPFLPEAEDTTYTGAGPVGTVAVQVSLPLGPGASAGFEVGFRLTVPSVPRAGMGVLDLNADGLGDPVGFSGPWLGLTVRLEFIL